MGPGRAWIPMAPHLPTRDSEEPKNRDKSAGMEMLDVITGDDSEWADRSKYWSERPTRPRDKRFLRQPSRDPLILAGHCVSLRIEAGTLLIRNGFTHYPQKARDLPLFQRGCGSSAAHHHAGRQRQHHVRRADVA
jgi:hypothetical protein